MKKAVLWLLIVTMIAVFSLASCDLKGEAEEAVSFKLGWQLLAVADPGLEAMSNQIENAVEGAGGEFITTTVSDFSPDSTIAGVEELINLGCDGVIFIPSADSMLPTIKQMCEEAEVYYAIAFRSILDPDIKEEVEASSCFVGNCREDEEEAGYQVTKRLADQGVTNLGLLGIAKGDTTGDTREVGIQEACDEFGVNIVAEARDFAQGSDATKAVESFLAAYPELDGVIIVGGGITPGILEGVITALEQHDKAGIVKVGMIDFTAYMPEALEKGYLHAACGGHTLVDPMFTSIMVINQVMGTPLSDEKITLTVNFMYLEDAEDATNYYKYVEGDVLPYTPEEIKDTMIKFYNPDITLEDVQEIALDYSLENVMERHKDLID